MFELFTACAGLEILQKKYKQFKKEAAKTSHDEEVRAKVKESDDSRSTRDIVISWLSIGCIAQFFILIFSFINRIHINGEPMSWLGWTVLILTVATVMFYDVFGKIKRAAKPDDLEAKKEVNKAD